MSEPQASAAPKARSRYYFLDALRGIAAAWVVAFHAFAGGHLDQLRRSMPGPVAWFFAHGHLGVPIFFVISGFVISLSIGADRVTLGYFGRFIARRSMRLDPPYWASIALVLGLAIVSGRVKGEVVEMPGWGNLLAHLVYAQGLLGLPPINDIYWTLCLEVQFYLVYCACLGVAQAIPIGEARSMRLVFGSAALVSLLWPLKIAPAAPVRGLFLPLWHGFLLGVFAHWMVSGRVGRPSFYAYALALGAAGVARSESFTVACVVAAVAVAEIGRAGRLQTWLDWRWLQFGGLISYSLYLIHNPITGAAFFVGYRATGRTPSAEALWFAAIFALNIAAASVFWLLVERPSIFLSHLLKVRTPRDRPPTPAGPHVPAPATARLFP